MQSSKGGGIDLQTAASFAQKKGEGGGGASASASIPIGISSPFLKQEIKIELPTASTTTPKPQALPFNQPLRFPKVNTANNRVPAGSSSKPGKFNPFPILNAFSIYCQYNPLSLCLFLLS